MSEDQMSPDASPGEVTKKTGVRRVNNLPVYIIGGLMGVLAGLIPGASGKMPIAGSIDLFKSGETNAIILGAAIVLVFLCGLGALAAGAQMFAPKWHGGPSRTGMTMGILMLIASLALIIVVGSSIFDGAELWTWLLLLACIPTIIGALMVQVLAAFWALVPHLQIAREQSPASAGRTATARAAAHGERGRTLGKGGLSLNLVHVRIRAPLPDLPDRALRGRFLPV